jgi:methyl-accepting chemotaxis protein
MFAHLKLSTRILLTGSIIAIGFPVPLLMWLLPEQRSNGYEMKAEATRHVVEAALGILNYYGKQVDAGAMSVSQAQSAARETIREARYGNGNYVWINDLHPTMIMHPANPALDGKDLSGIRDPNGIFLFLEAVRTCKTHGEGQIRYLWPKPDHTEPVPKVSYVKLYPPWGWIVGTGVYADDVEAALRRSRALIFMVTGLDLFGALILSYFMARSISLPVGQAAVNLMEFAGRTKSAANQVATASQAIASGVSQQAAAMEQAIIAPPCRNSGLITSKVSQARSAFGNWSPESAKWSRTVIVTWAR